MNSTVSSFSFVHVSYRLNADPVLVFARASTWCPALIKSLILPPAHLPLARSSRDLSGTSKSPNVSVSSVSIAPNLFIRLISAPVSKYTTTNSVGCAFSHALISSKLSFVRGCSEALIPEIEG
ncbi:unnamed protein product [Phytophthora lilii]|uniref:Unnamed protein product n=1 Tax=Phytophthora lilii TaxID=2077276 RepID=A0A9W6XFB6_9STRA|nr:unnamed protein product [Phytophthora lilii]